MLVLTRKVGEKVIIDTEISNDDFNHSIEIELLYIGDGQIRLGFKAPREITIHREEIKKRIKKDLAMGKTNEEKS